MVHKISKLSSTFTYKSNLFPITFLLFFFYENIQCTLSVELHVAIVCFPAKPEVLLPLESPGTTFTD